MSNSSILPCDDRQFLHSDECYGLRLELEYLKPEIGFSQQHVNSTIVLFGSARTLPPEVAAQRLKEAEEALAASPQDAGLKRKLAAAQTQMDCSRYYQVARDFGALCTRECQSRQLPSWDFVVLTGGGGGIMEAGNRGAADSGGISAALNIELPFEQHPNPYITPELSFQLMYFPIRKLHFLRRAKALGCFPGGFGTMDELFEALTLIQTGKIPKMPVMLFGRDFWDKLINWELFVEKGMISPEDLNLLTYCETAQEGWDAICDFYREK